MLSRSERILENIPVGSLGIIPLLGCEELGNKVNDYLVNGAAKALTSTRMMLLSPDMRKRII